MLSLTKKIYYRTIWLRTNQLKKFPHDLSTSEFSVDDANCSPKTYFAYPISEFCMSNKFLHAYQESSLKETNKSKSLLSNVTPVGSPVYEVMKLDPSGECRILYVRRRDLIRANYLQPRDLRRIDPQITLSKTLQGQTLLVKELIMIINIGGIKILCSAEKALLFDPSSLQSRRFLEILIPKLKFGIQNRQRMLKQPLINEKIEADAAKDDDYTKLARRRGRQPFELELIESALMVATGWLDSELVYVTRRLHQVLAKLPKHINPKNLEDLRKVKSALVELESRADALRELLEELLEDEDEIREFNLSSRPIRQEKKSRRERERLDRELEREKIALEGSEEELEKDWRSNSMIQDSDSNIKRFNEMNSCLKNQTKQNRFDAKKQANGRILRKSNSEFSVLPGSVNSFALSDARLSTSNFYSFEREQFSSMTEEELLEEDYEDAIEDLYDEKEAEKELAEIEDLFEYYLQSTVTTQAEAERSLQLARDLEESIGVNLSARRFEVNRLELSLAIGSFAVSFGALITGIFGMNLRSYLEDCKGGFVIVCLLITSIIFLIGFSLYRHTKARRIL